MSFALNLSLGQLILKFLTAKYIESAGDAAAQLERAQSVKTVAAELEGVALGTVTLAELTSTAEADLAKHSVSPANQILISGLASLVLGVLPALPTGPLLHAVNSAIADQFLKDVLSVTAVYGA